MNNLNGLLLFAAATLLVACGSTAPPQPAAGSPPAPVVEAQSAPAKPTAQVGQGGYLQGDGPGADVPANLDSIPDAVPRLEPIHRYANRPYEALGKSYTPLTTLGSYKDRGIASWYGKKFNGQRTSIGEIYDMYSMSAAHPTLPLPSYARVTNISNNKSVIVRVNDRGPFLHNRIIDLSYTAAYKLGMLGTGSSEVEVESLMPGNVSATPIVMPEPVRSEPLSSEPIAVASAQTVENKVYLQLGAFKSRLGAESFLTRMRSEFDGSGKQVILYENDDLTRVHIGPYASREDARMTAEKLQSRLGFKPFISMH